MNFGSNALLDSARQRHQRAISGYRQAGNRNREAYEFLMLARLESEHGDHERAILALRSAEAALAEVVEPATEQTHSLLRQLDELWQPYSDTRGKPRPPEPNAGRFDLAAELAFVWANLNPERTLLEIENQKSSTLLRVMRDDSRPRDQQLAEALANLGANERFVRPMETGNRSEAFVDYFVGDADTIVLLERPGTPLRCETLDVGRERIETVVARMRLEFDGGGMFMPIIPDRPFDVSLEEVYRLGRALMPFVDELKSADLICVFPHGALHSFPFAAIPLEDGSSLIDHAAVTVSPSRRTLGVARAAGRSTPGRPFFPRTALAVGVPAADEPNPDAFLGEANFLESLDVFEDVLGLETSGTTSVTRVISQFGRYDLAHFNCHGHFSQMTPLNSCLLLSDGRSGPRLGHGIKARDTGDLDARMIMQRCPAGTDVVVLRACSSGVTNVRAGDEQEGILRALIHVGTATCIVARWKIDAASSRELLRRFYRAWLVDRLPKAYALQRAQQSFLTDPCSYLKHPYHWAPFVIVGDWW